MEITTKQAQAIKSVLCWYGWIHAELEDMEEFRYLFKDRWVHPNRMKSLRQLFKDVELPKKKHKEIIKNEI